MFSHGFSIHFKTVVPPKNVDVILVAPKGPGHIVRRQYRRGQRRAGAIAVYQNPSEQAKKIALAWAKGIGATRAGVLRNDVQGGDGNGFIRRADGVMRRRERAGAGGL